VTPGYRPWHTGGIGKDSRLPRQRRSRETVSELLEAAAQVFTREGATATTNRIAARAGVSIGTLYRYFPDKEALLRALAQHHVADASNRLDGACTRLRADRRPFEDTMRALATAVVELHADRPGVHRVMHRLAPRAIRDLADLSALEERLTADVEFHMVRCGRGGPDTELTARTVVAAVDAHVHQVLTRRPIEPGRAVDQLVALINALAPPPR